LAQTKYKETGVATYRRVKNLFREDAAYIAGLVDGEGTVALSRRHRHENRQLVVSISNTDIELLKYVLKIIGAGRITRKRTYSDNHTLSATYTINNRQALGLLEQIVSYLRTYKAQRAKMILDHYLRLTPRNGKYTVELQRERNTFIQQFLLLNPRRQMAPQSLESN
jgi:intein/homing endonuclease